jgi:hypothetical protein
MMNDGHLRGLRGDTVAVAIAVLVAAGLQAQDVFVPLFTGTLEGWTVVNSTAGNFTVRDGLLRVEGPGGWLKSERQYGDFSLRAEFRFVTPDADSGLFVRVAGDAQFGRGWPNGAYQVQLRNPVTESRFPPVGGLFRHGVPPGDLAFDPALVGKVTKATGEWQLLEVDAIGESLAARLNGTDVMRAGNIATARGFIGLQGETGVVEFRRLEIQER